MCSKGGYMKVIVFIGCAAVAFSASFSVAQVQDESNAKPHSRHLHRHNPDHVVSDDRTRFYSGRDSAVVLPMPGEEDAFTFVVYGDRTGGPNAGVNILKDAVRDTNLLEPDFVMTVGDLIQGYNQTDVWLRQATEFKDVMDELICPWFPVAGNHDVYWRGDGKPEGEHDANYEMHFGPLWYAFEHKNCMFIVLYTDEGNPETGEKNFGKPECQEMSSDQLAWLAAMLEQSKDAEHVFVFLHHPRWTGANYGDSWDRVHEMFVDTGNVSGVFAGHIHRMRYDPRDGIDYITLATVGGHQNKTVPETGWLHHYNIVTVRPSQVAHSAFPVGTAMDVREITEDLASESEQLAGLVPTVAPSIALSSDGSSDGHTEITISNPTSRPVEYALSPESMDSRWSMWPDHAHGRLDPGQSATLGFDFRRLGSLDHTFRDIRFALEMDMLMPGHRYTIPTVYRDVPVRLDLENLQLAEQDRTLQLDGESYVTVQSDQFELPDGPVTLECWFKGDTYVGRTGLVAKTENSEFGFFVSDGKAEFAIHLGGQYATAAAKNETLSTSEWHHMAGVYDGSIVMLYVDGELASTVTRSGKRRSNAFPLVIGGDVNGKGQAVSLFKGQIGSVRLSDSARYSGASFTPERDWSDDEHTVLLYDMDREFGPWVIDESATGAHAKRNGAAELIETRE
jgi:hypothetical protein